MPNLRFNDSCFIGYKDDLAGTVVGLTLDDQSRLIKFDGGFINQSGYNHQLSIIASGSSTMSSANSIILFNLTGSSSVFLGNQPDGRIFYFRRIDSSSNLCTILRSGTDNIRLGTTASVTSFTMSADQAYTLCYSGATGSWFLVRQGGSSVGTPAPPPAPPPTPNPV